MPAIPQPNPPATTKLAEVTRAAIAEFRDRGFCVLRDHFDRDGLVLCRDAFQPVLDRYLLGSPPNRGPGRHFVPMPLEPPCFQLRFFADPTVVSIVRGLMDDRVVADQWGCDVPLPGSEFQAPHVDFARPLFAEAPDLALPPWIVLVSFGLAPIGRADGPIEIAPGTQRMPRAEALQAAEAAIRLEPVTLGLGDVLIRHPWAVHRGSPNRGARPRILASIRYVRRWYVDDSREVAAIPRTVWDTLPLDARGLLRFPIEG